jgi:hypothetical protein
MQTNLAETLPLFDKVASRTCPRCFDTGLWLAPQNQVLVCPRVQMNESHAEPNEAALMLRRAANMLFKREIYINSQAFDLARLLTNFTSERPCPRQEIFDTFYGDTNLTYSNQLRKFHAIIEELRQVWLLPVGSRKAEPCGYWVITDLDDFKAWYQRTTQAPITQLTTIHRVAKRNFPIFAEQIEFDFFNDIETEETAR